MRSCLSRSPDWSRSRHQAEVGGHVARVESKRSGSPMVRTKVSAVIGPTPRSGAGTRSPDISSSQSVSMALSSSRMLHRHARRGPAARARSLRADPCHLSAESLRQRLAKQSVFGEASVSAQALEGEAHAGDDVHALAHEVVAQLDLEQVALGFLGAVLDRMEQLRDRRGRCRASMWASFWSLLRSLVKMARSLRGLATSTSWPKLERNRLIHGLCVPTSRRCARRDTSARACGATPR